jgi:hypothetical protein
MTIVKKKGVYLYVMNRVYGNAILTLLSGMIFAGGGAAHLGSVLMRFVQSL